MFIIMFRDIYKSLDNIMSAQFVHFNFTVGDPCDVKTFTCILDYLIYCRRKERGRDCVSGNVE